MRSKTYLTPEQQWDRTAALALTAPQGQVYRRELVFVSCCISRARRERVEALRSLTREQWLTELSIPHMQSGIRNPRVILTIRILLTITGLLTLAGGLMGIYGIITHLQAWQGDPVSVIVAVLLTVLLLVGGGCLLRCSLKYDGHPG